MNELTHEELVKIQKEEYPSSVILTWGQFKTLHQDSHFAEKQTIDWYQENHPNAVCYYLKTKAHDDGHYNGIRFGKAGDYCSFTHINPDEVTDEPSNGTDA